VKTAASGLVNLYRTAGIENDNSFCCMSYRCWIGTICCVDI